MPKRSPPGDRDRIEAVLERAGLLEALVEACVVFGIPRDSWQAVPAVQVVFEQAAVEHRARELREGDGLSDRGAIERAAAELGVVIDTARGRHEQWRRQAVENVV